MSEMEICEEKEVIRRCIKYKERLFDGLNIVYNESNSTILFWNTYQIFVHDDQNFDDVGKVIVPDFLIQKLFTTNNHIICLDTTGNVHVTSLKFKNAAQKRLKSSFHRREQGVLNCIKYSSDTAASLKYELGNYLLCLHKINTEFQLIHSIVFRYKEQFERPMNSSGHFMLYSQVINKENYEHIHEIFKREENWRCHSLVVISLDQTTVYGCLVSQSPTQEEILLTKLYTSPSEICEIKFDERDLNLILCLSIGTLVTLSLRELNRIPDITHLNTAISKCMYLKSNVLIYTDGLDMWKAEEILSKDNIKFKHFSVNYVKDFTQFGEQIICTTFSNLIYIINPLEKDESHLKSETTTGYCSADKLLNNSDCLCKIMNEIETNKEIIKKIDEEGTYLMILSLSKRHDVMDKIINQKVTLHECYMEVIKENPEVVLTEELKEYFEPEPLYFLIKITTLISQHSLNSIFSNMFGDLKIHVNITDEEKVLKTISIKLTGQLTNIQILIPLQARKMLSDKIKVETKLVSNIPGVLEEKQSVWTTLYSKIVVFNTEQFIKTNFDQNRIISLKEPGQSIEELISKTTSNHCGDLFKITNRSNKNLNRNYNFYVKLPFNYKAALKSQEYYQNHFNKQKADFIHRQLSSEDFLNTKSTINFEIGNENVELEIIDDFSSPLLKITCPNIERGFGIRNFMANIVYNDFKNQTPGKEFVNYSLYTVIENLQKAIKKCIRDERLDELETLIHRFHKNVIGALPL